MSRWFSSSNPAPAASGLSTSAELAVCRSRLDQIDALVADGLRGRLTKDTLLDIHLILHPITVRPSVPVIPGRDGA